VEGRSAKWIRNDEVRFNFQHVHIIIKCFIIYRERKTYINTQNYFRYVNGDFYEGYFKDGLPHGHGVKKEGHFMASVASVYIGEWAAGVKQGYGIMDDIMTGINN